MFIPQFYFLRREEDTEMSAGLRCNNKKPALNRRQGEFTMTGKENSFFLRENKKKCLFISKVRADGHQWKCKTTHGQIKTIWYSVLRCQRDCMTSSSGCGHYSKFTTEAAWHSSCGLRSPGSGALMPASPAWSVEPVSTQQRCHLLRTVCRKNEFF